MTAPDSASEPKSRGASSSLIRRFDALHALYLFGFALLAFAFSSLFTMGTQYGFAKGVEYWLFRPTDNSPAIVAFLSAWLAYRRWPRLRALPRHSGPGWLVVAALASAQLVFAWAVYTGAADLQVFALVATIIGLVAAHWGVAGLRVLWLPIFFLLFAVPMPAPFLLALVFKLQLWTANYAGWILYVFGVPALVSGDQILRAAQSFQVIEGCSGLRSLETLTMLTILLIDLFRRTGWHALILVIAAPFIAFMLNGFRVVTLILNPYSEIIAIHNLQGIVILLAGLLLVYFIDGLLERLPLQLGPRAKVSKEGASFAPRLALGALLVTASASALLLVSVPTWEEPGPHRHDFAQLITGALEPWPSQKNEPDFVFRGSARFGQIVDRRFSVGDTSVDVFAATADFGQRGGSPRSASTAVPGSGWLVRDAALAPRRDSDRFANVRVVEKGKQRRLVYHYYEGDRGLVVETLRSLFALDRSPWRRDRPLAVVRISTPIHDRSDAARKAAEDRVARALERVEPALEDFLGSASAAS